MIGASGRAVPYDTLVLATGSRPYVPAINGLDRKAGVFVFRTLDDTRELLRRAAAVAIKICALGSAETGVGVAAA